MKRNGRSNGNKWVVYVKAPIDDILVVAHKSWDSLSIKTVNNYKRKEQHNPKVHTILIKKKKKKNHSKPFSL